MDMDGIPSILRPGMCFLVQLLKTSLSGPGALTFLPMEPTPPGRFIQTGLPSALSLPMRLRFDVGVPENCGRLLRELGRRGEGPSADPGVTLGRSKLCLGVDNEDMVLMLLRLLGGK